MYICPFIQKESIHQSLIQIGEGREKGLIKIETKVTQKVAWFPDACVLQQRGRSFTPSLACSLLQSVLQSRLKLVIEKKFLGSIHPGLLHTDCVVPEILPHPPPSPAVSPTLHCTPPSSLSGGLSDTGLSEPAGAEAAVQQVDKLVLTVSWGWALL